MERTSASVCISAQDGALHSSSTLGVALTPETQQTTEARLCSPKLEVSSPPQCFIEVESIEQQEDFDSSFTALLNLNSEGAALGAAQSDPFGCGTQNVVAVAVSPVPEAGCSSSLGKLSLGLSCAVS